MVRRRKGRWGEQSVAVVRESPKRAVGGDVTCVKHGNMCWGGVRRWWLGKVIGKRKELGKKKTLTVAVL